MALCKVCNKNEAEYMSVEFPSPICKECGEKLLKEYIEVHGDKWGYELLDFCTPLPKERK